MKLARKLTLALVLGITLVMAGNALFQVRREADAVRRRLVDAISTPSAACCTPPSRQCGARTARRRRAGSSPTRAESNPDLTLRWVSLVA